MRNCLSVLLILFYLPAFSQENDFRIFLKSGTEVPAKNIKASVVDQVNKQLYTSGTVFTILQFDEILSVQAKQRLQQSGIEIIEYIPEKSYIAKITRSLSVEVLLQHKTRSVIDIKPVHKIDPALTAFLADTSATDVIIAFYKTIGRDEIIAFLQANGLQTDPGALTYNILRFRTRGNSLSKLAALPIVQFIEKAAPPSQDLNDNSTRGARANILQSKIPGGYGLTGEGISVMIDELDGTPQAHVDYADRLLTGVTDFTPTYHPSHVHGIVGGAGNVNELYRGYAPKVKLLSENSFAATSQVSLLNYIQNYGITLTNNSFANGAICMPQGYAMNNIAVDKSSTDFPSLLHVFAVGNSGTSSCTNYPAGFNTVVANSNSAKNVISVGNTLNTGVLFAGSSKGPGTGGRLKPDITATGTAVVSTVSFNDYFTNTGTSMSAPAVVGGLALLYQRYMALHNGVMPKGGLMKAILCNSATDLGNPGPDFSYGFGWMNLLRAVQTIDSNRFFVDSVAFTSTRTHTITVPANLAQLKIMLYWHDPATSASTPKALVNDLDLNVMTASGVKHLPMVLDTLPALVNNNAKEGEDHINNAEQVVIDNPQPGNYTITVKGTAITENPTQEYFIAYDLVQNNVQLTFPFGGEGLVPGENIKIQWDAFGQSTSSFSLQFSTDNGASWQSIDNAIASDKRQYDWVVPALPTDKGLIRLTRNADNKTSTSSKFVIVGLPAITLAATQCPGYINLTWPAVQGADDYEVMMLKEGEMKSVAVVTGTNFIFKNLSEDSTYWVTVRARVGGSAGRRAVALSRMPSDGNCSGAISDHDIKMHALLLQSGRKFTSTALQANQKIRVQIKNLDDQPINGYTVKYSVNNGPWITENSSASIAPSEIIVHEFAIPFDFSSPGTYLIKLVAEHASDNNRLNDTIVSTIRHLDNQLVDLSTPVIENFDAAPEKTYRHTMIGITGAERFDYVESGLTRQTKISSVRDGNKKILLENLYTGFIAASQYIIATYNLSSYDTATTAVELDFALFRNATSGGDTLWVRGADFLPWIKVMSLPLLQSQVIKGIEITNALRNAGQNFSSSFQLRWANRSFGFEVDDIRLYGANYDLDLNMDSIKLSYCGLNTALPITVNINNHWYKPLNNVKVYYKVDNGATVSETIASIPGDSTIQYQFATAANVSSKGTHTIEAWVEHASDTYLSNNRQTITIHNEPLINVFPYLEDFEKGTGEYYTEGNTSWQYGTPSSAKISGAASGTKAWKTNLSGNYKLNESGYLYSPCFDISTLQRPYLSFSVALNTDDVCLPAVACDYMQVQFSTNGDRWTNLNANNLSYNWGASVWASKSYFRWHVATRILPDTLGTIRFRFFFRSDNNNVFEGVGIDDIHIYDSTSSIHPLPNAITSVTENVTGNNWITFKESGKTIAAIQPNGQDLGATKLTAFSNAGQTRHFHGQYYLNRSFLIQPANALKDSVTVRLYYLDAETDSLLFATSCSGCTKPLHAYRLGISNYHSLKSSELNDKVLDDRSGTWSFIDHPRIKFVPYDKGYYAEFKTKDLSEFWLSNGGLNERSYLPTEVLQFEAQRSGNDVNLQWTTAMEINIDHFDIEIAKGNEAFNQDNFFKHFEVKSGGRSASTQTYHFKDADPGKQGVYYYRLKLVDKYGNASYSQALPIVFSEEFEWKVAPNPSHGTFYVLCQVNKGDAIDARVYNSLGGLVKAQRFTGEGFIQQLEVNMGAFANGLYMIKLSTGKDFHILKLVKN